MKQSRCSRAVLVETWLDIRGLGEGEEKPEALEGTTGFWGQESKAHCPIQPTHHEDPEAWALRCLKTCPKLHDPEGQSQNCIPHTTLLVQSSIMVNKLLISH